MKILLSLIFFYFSSPLCAENKLRENPLNDVLVNSSLLQPYRERFKNVIQNEGDIRDLLLNDKTHQTELLKQRICDLLPSLHGWCSQEKALTLIDLTLLLKPKVCVDIGVFGGSSLLPVAATLKFLGSGVVIGIDPWEKFESTRYFDPVRDEASLKWWSQVDHNDIYNFYLKILEQFALENYCMTKRMTSQRAAPAIDQIDLLHIDGNHSEESFTNDVKTYLPKVRTGGYILLNDCLWDNAQVAMEFLLEQCEVVELIDCGNCIVFKKR